MKITCIGGGPGGLYFAALAKKAAPDWDVTVYERNRPDDTFGFGVVFSDETLGNLRTADPVTYERIAESFSHWDEIDVHYQGQVLRSTGHGFSGLSRRSLLDILQSRCADLGVQVHFGTEAPALDALGDSDLIVAADGVNSQIRRAHASDFGADVRESTNRFVWLGTTRRFPAFTFYFRRNEHGLWRVHAYNYDSHHSTFIVECTEETWRRAGLADATEEESADYCEALFAEELQGHALLRNRSIWRTFPTISCARWSHQNLVLIGDAVHTAHFSVGSGTKLAMEDGIALVEALRRHAGVAEALSDYETARRPAVASTQRAAAVSMAWFESTERYFGRLEPLQFAFSLLTRSLRITHGNLRVRDPEFTDRVDAWFSSQASEPSEATGPRPPMFVPFALRGLTLPNRIVVSPMCTYSAVDGTPNDWHLVHLGSRAVGGAGLVMTEMTDVSEEGRITPGCAGLYRDEHVAAWRRITDFVHANSAGAIGVQLGHAGRKGSTRLMWEGMDRPLPEGGWPLISASALPYRPESQTPREMSKSDMDRVRDQFVRAAGYADEAGFDLLELHFAHGYLLACFISPLTNQRSDAYGGDLDGRLRFPLEVFDAVRAAWPEEKPISVRISATDWAPGGTTGDDAVAIARALREHGCDIVDVSTGQTVSDAQPEYGRLYQTPLSERVRLEADVPTITVGGVSSYADVNSILAAGRADLCALARAHLMDPYWTMHAAFEQGVPLTTPPPYGVLQRYTPRYEWTVRGNEKD